MVQFLIFVPMKNCSFWKMKQGTIQTKDIFSKILMNCGQSHLNTEAMMFVLQSINFHLRHKNMHAACQQGLYRIVDEFTIQMNIGALYVSNRKAKDNCHRVHLFLL